MSSSWEPAQNYRSRPVAILGGGVLGRRIAACWASAGYKVQVREPNAVTGELCTEYVKENVESYPSAKANKGKWGSVSVHQDLKAALEDAWLVIEAIPEKLELKISTFAELESIAPQDAILASNSSSYRSGEMLEKISDATKTRVMNTHYFMPPETMLVEVMTSGHTDPAIISFMVERQKEAGTIPYVARKESTGFIFNRLWAAVKREILTILSEGVSVPEEIDAMWKKMFIDGSIEPCRLMDKIGLDTVAFIEEHYIHERGLSSEKTVGYLKKNFLDPGRLGNKSSKGGLYPRVPKLLVLDVGLAAKENISTAGKILEVSADGKSKKVLVGGQRLPDGIDYDLDAGRMFWTCMGRPGDDDGEVFSANLDGSDVKSIVPKGVVNTPKQLVVEPASKKLYFCDREGMRVVRCDYDGGNFEVLVKNGDWKAEGIDDKHKWCVGIMVSPKLGKFFWTQKGPSKSGVGKIFCADIDGPATADRKDIQLVLDRLPEPIDLDIDESTNTLYWTDRGELPLGNTLNKAQLDPATCQVVPGKDGKKHSILHTHFSETIGLRLDVAAGNVYVTDLGGSVYRCGLDGGEKERIVSDDNAAFTGIAIL
ncbi:hypothetical protein F4802DRAFT_620684 [Xylaria palmicola]|nr:hypothetical protein F4802DRAFT_620684 [Xylaria palmicola]